MADISIQKVTKSYGKTQVVHGVDLEISHGEFIVILGPSGCGKSTLLRMIAGLEAINSGEIAIAGRVVNELEPRDRGCAMVFQNYALYPHMTVGENIGYSLKVAGCPKAERARRVADVANIVGLGEFMDRKPGQLSGGQRQRVAMARAMIKEPQIFLFDEPLSNLDAKLRVQMRIEIRRLHQRLGGTSVFVTHDQVEAMTLADRLVVMNAGRIEQVGTPREIYHHPASLFVADFIGSPPMNALRAHVLRPGLAKLQSGAEIHFDPTLDATPGSEVTLGIRPEEVEIVAPGSEGALIVSLEFIEELGSGNLAHGLLEDAHFVVAFAAGTAPRKCETLEVSFPSTSIHLFNAETGLRILPKLDSYPR